MKKYCFLITAIALAISLHAKETREITLEKIWLKGSFSQKSVYGLNSMKDGMHYTVLERNDDGVQVINKYDYKKKSAVGNILTNTLKTTEGKDLRIESYEFSADEGKLLLKTESERIYRHSMRSAYYVYDLGAGQLKRIGDGKFQLAEFSPDGKYVSFVRKNNLYLYELSSGKEIPVTTKGEENKIIFGAPDWVYEEEFTLVKGYEWSPDSKNLAYYRFDESNVREFSFPVYGNLYPENYVYKYPKVGEENSKVNLFLYNTESGNSIAVNHVNAYEYIPKIQWIPYNNMLAVQLMNREQNQLNLEVCNPKTGQSFLLAREDNETYVDVKDIYFYKNRPSYIWLSENSGYNHIYYYEYNLESLDTDGEVLIHDKRQLTDGPDPVTNLIGVEETNNVVYYQFADRFNPTDRQTMMLPLEEKEELFQRPLPFPAGYTSVVPSSNYQYFIVYASTAVMPTIVAIHDNEGHPVRMLEENEALRDTLSNYVISYKQFLKFKNRNGDELVGWMIKPPNFDPNKKYPLLMYVYGGPGSQTVLNRWEGGNYMWYQYLAQKGYIVVSIDNRGTGARSKEFRDCTYGQLGKLESEDQIDAALYFSKMNFIDENRIGIWGWSYGGYMSTLCLAKGADVFKMAIAVAPVTNWRYYDSIYTERYMGLLKDNAEAYDENSPINHVNKIKGKYLLVHGTADDNVHFQNSTELIDALVKNDVQFDLAIYPNKNHGIYGGNTRFHLYTKMTDFILENL